MIAPGAPIEAPPIQYLNFGGGEHLWLSQGVSPYIFSLRDMYRSLVRASVVMSIEPIVVTLSAQTSEPEPQTAEDFIERNALGVELARIATLAKETLGASTTMTYRLRRMREDDAQELVLEVRYRKSKTARQRSRQFLERYASEIPAEVQQEITLLRLPK